MQAHPHPSKGKTYGACTGYVSDQVGPLKGGGADLPRNMQRQMTGEANAKDELA